ncbi:MAG TPA: hypothetical protein DGT21_12015 [Armatimonadetes bacterium]|nr:hypothetical protein [Armatimonadota bacterium]
MSTGAVEGNARTLYVSKLGDGSDGLTWATAFRSIQDALSAVPDAEGGRRVVVRPDTYFEANLFPAHRGAAGAYNELIGDVDGRYGSGRTGRVVIDSGDSAQQGFKSYDWWGPIRAYDHGWSPQHTEPTFSAIGWDRWAFRNLYVTGGDGGLFFDGTDHVEPFSVLVEDCVSIGRAFGGGVASVLSRPEEPITFRRCKLWALDWWGDTAAAYLRVENETMPSEPDVLLEDCTMVSPVCALKAGNYGFHTFTRVHVNRCVLIALNFSQPHGTPSPGIIQSVQEGKLLHVDLQDSTLMGYQVFGVLVDTETSHDIGYSTKGDVRAYVQFQQGVPTGMHRLGGWPVEAFEAVALPCPASPSRYVSRELVMRDMCEVTPFIWRERLCLLECHRPASGGAISEHYLALTDADTGEEFARLAEGYGLACTLVEGETIHVFASRWEDGTWRDVTVFRSENLTDWRQEVVIRGESEGLFNTSVCKGPDGFVMAYESNDATYPPFTIKLATSADLESWEKLPEGTFGIDRYAACPCIRYAEGYYYLMYLEHRAPRHYFETYIARSSDLLHWEWSTANPILSPEGLDEGINASDPDIVEWRGETILYFCVGDQLTWANVKRVTWPGPLTEFLQSWFTEPGVPTR